MSPKRNLTVSELVKKYRDQFSSEKRPHLRRRLRTEKPELFKDNPSNLRKLDRYLRKEFAKEPSSKKTGVIIPNSEVTPQKCDWNPAPDFAFSPKFEEAHRKIREPFEVDSDEPPKFPTVPFNWHNWSPYQLKVRLEVRVFLGGRNQGLIKDPKGYYNGEAFNIAEPYVGRLRDGCFTLPQECTQSTEETTIEVRARILDQNDVEKKEYHIIRSWSYSPKEKYWYYEPKSFKEDLSSSNEKRSLWTVLLSQMEEVGGHLTKVYVEKLRLGDYDTITGIPEMIYDKIFSVEGIIVLKGATKLEAVLGLRISYEYLAFFASQFPIEQGDRVKWREGIYFVKGVEPFFEGEILNYTIAKLAR